MNAVEIKTPEALLAEPVGAVGWVQLLGRCMLPVLRSGDLLRVRRCEEADVRRGDVVIVKGQDSRFLAHLSTTDGAPLRTATLAGLEDPVGLVLVGRAERLRRRGFEVPLGPGRFAIWWLHRVRTRLRGRVAWSRLARGLDAARLAPGILHLRRRLLPACEVRELSMLDIEEVLPFAAHYLKVPLPFLQKQLWHRWGKTGLAVGAFDVRGRLRGFAYADAFEQEGLHLEGAWVRSLFVEPAFRGLGLARRLIRALVDGLARQRVNVVRADVPADNVESQHAFASEGFSRAGVDWDRRVAQEWARNGVRDRWVVFERRSL